jgi:hypothetical protein
VERRPGSWGRRISTCDQDKQLLNVTRNSPFTTAIAAVSISNFPGSVRTSAVVCGIVNFETTQLLGPRQKNAKVGFALEHLAKDNAFLSRVVFSDEKVFESSRNGPLKIYRPRNSRYERYVESTEQSGRFSINV